MYNLVNKQTEEIITTMSEPIDCWQVRNGIAEWEKIEPSLQQCQQEKISVIYTGYINARQSIIWSNGKGYDADEGSQKDFTQAFKTVEVLRRRWVEGGQQESEPTVPYRVWVEEGKKDVLPHKVSDFEDAQIAGSEAAYQAFLKFDSLRNKVAAATTLEEIEAISW